ncbi:Rad1/Rec1/Rad17 [Phakopsora pachyrhizi]|uniref:Rad1/Rec1/Rad17 n=1 Tax=Phakopsora pachyrhizi TaxID=170000 RepID=A0AAV0B2H6_PHAPC|nr:Rad1/Rec1/Rad17 [Phakopsora pachyrhizi]CAH7676511.1 Rad1/Rec1/Rad17 [Phakopsora pachyrhizi]
MGSVLLNLNLLNQSPRLNQTSDQQQSVFYCYSDCLRSLSILLSTLNFSRRCNFQISDTGIHLDLQVGNTLQAHAYLEKSTFSEWYFSNPNQSTLPTTQVGGINSDDRSAVVDRFSDVVCQLSNQSTPSQEQQELSNYQFEISISTLIECLNIFGTASATTSNTNTNTNTNSNQKFNYNPKPPLNSLANGYEDQVDGRDQKGSRSVFRHGSDDRSRLVRRQPSSAIRITYDGLGQPLVLLIEDSGVVTRCALVTYEPEELAEMMFLKENQVVQLIMKSDWLKSAFEQFDEKTSTEITMIFCSKAYNDHLRRKQASKTNQSRKSNRNNSPDSHHVKHQVNDEEEEEEGLSYPSFRIQVDGTMGDWIIDFPNDRDILESFEFNLPDHLDDEGIETMGIVKNSYKLSNILKFKKALDVSTKASLRVDDTGFMSLQLLIPLDESSNLRVKKGYVEFLCVPIEDG